MDQCDAMNIEIVCDRAVDYFLSGWNCGEAVFLAVCDEVASDKKNLAHLMTGLGYGMGRSGLVCGALTAAIICSGMKHGRLQLDRRQEVRSYKVSKDICRQFTESFKYTGCSDLLKHSISLDGKKKTCPEFVREAARLAMESLKDKTVK